MEEPAALPTAHDATSMAPHGDTVAGTEVAVHHDEPTSLGLTAEAWVYVSLTIFFLLTIFVAKAPRKIAAGLDARIAETRRQLDEAKAVRAEAEALLADAKARQQAAASDAAAIVAHAESEAGQLVAKAQADADTLIERRRRMAEDKIEAAERQAVAGVRQAAADAAAKAARSVIASQLSAADGKKLASEAIEALRVN